MAKWHDGDGNLRAKNYIWDGAQWVVRTTGMGSGGSDDAGSPGVKWHDSNGMVKMRNYGWDAGNLRWVEQVT